MWLNSIQVSKGVASVTAGHEAITGQINLEHRKPTDDERLFVNLYLDDELRPEANISTALPVTRDKKLSTVILLHGSADTDVRKMDHNEDTFRDLPRADQINVANKWLYSADNGLQLRWGWKFVQENRLGGQHGYKRSMRELMERDWENGGKEGGPLYGSHIRNRNANGYVKLGMPVGASVYDADEQDELRSNIAAIVDFDHFDEAAYFGLNDYAGNENALSANLMYNHYFTYRSSLIVGLSGQIHHYDETVLNPTPWLDHTGALHDEPQGARSGCLCRIHLRHQGEILGRGGSSRRLQHLLRQVLPHAPRPREMEHHPSTVLRASAGLGYRSTNLITDNIGVLATGRRFDIRGGFHNLDRMEKALTVGGSLTQTFGLVRPGDATLSFDYFRTQFYNQVVADQEYRSDLVLFYDTDGRSYTDSWQVDFTWSPVERLDIFATFRYTDSAITLDRPDGSRRRVERPLISEYKTLLNLQYATKFRRWTFDVTAQLNGPSRLPSLDGNLDDLRYSPRYPVFFAQVSHKMGKFDVYVGCENIADYVQKDPITVDGHAFRPGDNPFQTSFNSSSVWGPLMGRKFYIGMRFNLY